MENKNKELLHFNEKNEEKLENELLDVEQELEEIDDDDENSDDIPGKDIIQPFNPNDIKISTSTMAMESLIKRLKFDEIDLNPDFQRHNNLWNRKKMSRLIESIILKLPLPVFYFDVTDSGNWIVIDGLQRLSTLKKFVVKNDLKLKHLEFLKELEGKTFQELERKHQRTIEETQIVTYQMEPQTPNEVKYSIFNRINTGGLMLNSQEIRQALNQKNHGANFLKETAEAEEFKNIVRINSKRMIDRELVLRFVAFYLHDIDYFKNEAKSLSNFLDNTMEEIDSADFKESTFSEIRYVLFETLNFLEQLFGKNNLFNKKLKNPKITATLNRSLFEVTTVLFSKLDSKNKEKILNNKENFIKNYIDILVNTEFDEVITKGTNDKKAVVKRFEIFEQFLLENLEEKN